MTTEVTAHDSATWSSAIAAISYLERNDFTSISQISLRLLRAQDGQRRVLIWLDSSTGDHAIPMELVKMAKVEGSRIDIISIDSDWGTLVHQMNVVEAG